MRLGTRLYFAFLLLGTVACIYAAVSPPTDLRRFYILVILFAAGPAIVIYLVTRLLAWVFSPDDRRLRQPPLVYVAMVFAALVFAGVAAIPYYFEI